jgi:hypothetical protein
LPELQVSIAFYNPNDPAQVAAYEAARQKKRAERARGEKPERDAVIRLYGGEEAALAPCAREVKLRGAVRHLAVFSDPPHQRWTRSIGSWTVVNGWIPADVRKLLSSAYPLPATVEEAWAEYSYWEKRDHELGLVLEDTLENQLDMPAYGRREIVQELLRTGLRARTINDVLIRQRLYMTRDFEWQEVEMAILADLEALAGESRTDAQPDDSNGVVQYRRDEAIRVL